MQKLYRSSFLKKSFDDYNLEIILNPVGLSGHLKARKLNLNYQQWMKDGWIEVY